MQGNTEQHQLTLISQLCGSITAEVIKLCMFILNLVSLLPLIDPNTSLYLTVSPLALKVYRAKIFCQSCKLSKCTGVISLFLSFSGLA